MSSIHIAEKKHSFQVASLHYHTISQGFLSSLGINFLNSLYSFLIQHELVLVYQVNSKVVGFVSCALSSKGIMKRFLVSNFSGIFHILIALIKDPFLLKSLWETYRAPSLSEFTNNDDIVMTELLSISVDPLAQEKGIGSQLLLALEKELKIRNVSKYKVIAGQKLGKANSFYLKNGFELRKQITIHGDELSNIYIKEIL